MSVFGFVPTRDEPAECLPWTRRTGVRLSLPCFGEVGVRSGQQLAYATRIGMFVSSLEFQVGSCLYVTAAVQAGLTPQRGQSDRSTFEVHWNLLEP